MKRIFFIYFIITLICCLTWVDHSVAQKKLLTISSATPGGAYYPMAGGMAVIIQKTTDLRCAAESTGGSIENCRLIGSGESDMGISMGSTAYDATLGKKPFEKKIPLAALFNMYSAPEHIVTIPGKGITSIKDFKGKKVSIDVPGTGGSVMAKAIMEEYGFDLAKDLTIANLNPAESVMAFKDGLIDAWFYNVAYPAANVLDLAAGRGLILIPIEPPMVDRFLKKYPYYIKITIPAKTYPKMEQDVLCLGDSNLLVVNERMEEEVAYKITKAVFENVDKGKWALTSIHPVAAQMNPKTAVNSPIKLHPGAERYFREVGAIK